MKPIEIADWHEVPLGEPLAVDVHGPRARTATYEVNSTAEVNVFASYGGDLEEAVLVAALPRGRSALELLIAESAVMWFQQTSKGQRVFTRKKARAQALQPYDGEKFTTLEPRRSGNEEFERVAMLMHQNQQRLMQQWERERQALEAKLADNGEAQPAAEPDPEPEPEPTPATLTADPNDE